MTLDVAVTRIRIEVPSSGFIQLVEQFPRFVLIKS